MNPGGDRGRSCSESNGDGKGNGHGGGGGNKDDNDKGVEMAARSLIAKLKGDFRAEGKRTCRDCLRSKTLPCPRVVELAEQGFPAGAEGGGALPVLARAQMILLAGCKNALPPEGGLGAEADRTSLVCMDQTSAVLRFVQLLLLLSERGHGEAPAETCSVAEAHKMTGSLLRKWTSGMSAFLGAKRIRGTGASSSSSSSSSSGGAGDGKDPLTADATIGVRRGPVFCHAFCSLLRMNEYVQKRGPLLVPLWKGICDLAETLVAIDDEDDDGEASGGGKEDGDDDNDNDDNDDDENDDSDWRDHLPPSLLGDAIRILGDFIREGKERLELGFAARCLVLGKTDTSAAGNDPIAFQGKFVGFLVARMAHLLRICFSVRGHGVAQDENTRAGNAPTHDAWRSLLGLRGTATALQLLRSAEDNRAASAQDTDLAVLKVYCELAAKAGKCVAGIVVPKTNGTKNRPRVLTPALESLLRSEMVDRGDADDGKNEESHRHRDCDDDVRSRALRLSTMGRTTGKVLVLQQVLQLILGKGGGSGTAEPLLATMETLLSSSIPQCLSACIVAVRSGGGGPGAMPTQATLPSTIVDGSLGAMARALREIESSPDLAAPSQRGAYNRLLVRWLASVTGGTPRTPNASASAPQRRHPCRQHPLAREMVLSLLHTHLAGTMANAREPGSPGSGPGLLACLTKLWMDPRTSLLLRRNIGALLVRLQSPPPSGGASEAFQETVRRKIEAEFEAWWNQGAALHQAPGKRKRKRNRCPSPLRLRQQDVLVVSRVLGSGRTVSRSLGSSSAGGECLSKTLRKEFSRLSSVCANPSAQSGRELLAFADRNSLLLAWLERFVAAGPGSSSLERFRQVTGLDAFSDVMQPVLSLVSSLKFKPKHGSDGNGNGNSNGDSTQTLKKKVMLYAAAMRLSATTATAFGENGKLPLEKVCLLIKHAVQKEAFRETNGNAIDGAVLRDQHSILTFEALNLLRCIGKAIPSVCSDRVLRTIRRAFSSFLSSDDWAVASLGISSVMSFGSDLHEAHQQILPLCLSRSSTGLFQARASGRVWRGTDPDGNPLTVEASESVLGVVDKMAHQWHGATHPAEGRKPTVRGVLGSTTASAIAHGSYVLEMPTQGDRTATVVFPPGPQSLEDIRYMLGLQDGGEVPAKRLKRAVATAGGGLRMLLVPV